VSSNDKVTSQELQKIKGMKTGKGGSSGAYRKLADMVWTWHGAAESSRYEQWWSATVDSRVRRTGSDDVDADLIAKSVSWSCITRR